MEVLEVDLNEYNHWIKRPYYVFGSGDFADLNSKKVEKVHYLLFSDGKIRLGLTGGIRGNIFASPFSAPFGGFVHLREDIKINHIDNACQSFIQWVSQNGFKGIDFKLPPSIYGESFISKQINSLFRHHFSISDIDVNYSFDTAQFNEDYISNIWYNARKNLKISLNNKIKFQLCTNSKQKQLAYHIIEINRELRGFPLRMTWDQIEETIDLISADFFICLDRQDIPIASTIAFHVSDDIVQIVYWGDIPEYSNLKTMNFMAYKVFEYYKSRGIKIVDIGPSSENSIPNFGLCEFKESIGCQVSTKYHFKREFYED